MLVVAARIIGVSTAEEPVRRVEDVGLVPRRVHPPGHDGIYSRVASGHVLTERRPLETLRFDALDHGRAVRACMGHRVVRCLVYRVQVGCGKKLVVAAHWCHVDLRTLFVHGVEEQRLHRTARRVRLQRSMLPTKPIREWSGRNDIVEAMDTDGLMAEQEGGKHGGERPALGLQVVVGGGSRHTRGGAGPTRE